MKNTIWDSISAKDVEKAIELFDKSKESYPKEKNTILLYNDKKYPAKHIRGLAYYVANKKEISKNNYGGGQETVNFFKKLGFTISYKTENPKLSETSSRSANRTNQVVFQKKTSAKLHVLSQKKALHRLLEKHYGPIETEKRFDWLRTPNTDNIPKEYLPIVNALIAYRNQNGFQKSNYHPRCDFVLEDHKLIIEYDENQHFSKARKFTLENYQKNIEIYFSKEDWIKACEKLDAKDNNPPDRDEIRAFYDTVRDIEAPRHGYKLIRIKHGDVDWESDLAEAYFRDHYTSSQTEKKTMNHKIARLIVTGKHYDENAEPNYDNIYALIEQFLTETYKKSHFEFIITPGGFLKFEIPEEISIENINDDSEAKLVTSLQKLANKTVLEFFKTLPLPTLKKLKETADYFTIGIDGRKPPLESSKLTIELVAIYDLKSGTVIHWTGKFYPTTDQIRKLIKVNNLETHFIKLNSQNIVILGCHDLNIFSPRGQANAIPNGWRKRLADNFKSICKNYNPDIILQHPHTTDTSKTWISAWGAVKRELPNVKHYASGIKFYRKDGVRQEISKVLEKTKIGDVIDFTFD